MNAADRSCVRPLLAVLLCLMASTAVVAETPWPADVQRFVTRRDQCDHFRGEEPYDAARGRYIAQQAKRFCTGTDKALEALRQRHRNNVRVMKLLDGHERSIEGL